MTAANDTVIIGDEFDHGLKLKVISLVKKMGAEIVEHDWAMAGSQEIESVEFRLNNRSLYLQSETYIGLTLRGAAEDIKQLTDMIH